MRLLARAILTIHGTLLVLATAGACGNYEPAPTPQQCITFCAPAGVCSYSVQASNPSVACVCEDAHGNCAGED